MTSCKNRRKQKKQVELLIDQIKSNLDEIQEIIYYLIKSEDTEYILVKIRNSLNLVRKKLSDLEKKIEKLEQKNIEMMLEIQALNHKYNELRNRYKAEPEKEVNRKCRGFAGRFLYTLARKLNYVSILALSEAYEFSTKKSVKEDIKSQLSDIKMTLKEFEQLQDFILRANELSHHSHRVKNQSEKEAQIMLNEMKFPANMEYLRSPLNKALNALKNWKTRQAAEKSRKKERN